MHKVSREGSVACPDSQVKVVHKAVAVVVAAVLLEETPLFSLECDTSRGSVL